MKNTWVIRVLLLGCLAASVLAHGQEKPATYPESANGFRQYLTDLINLKKSGDEKSFAVLLESAVLPDADTWMRESFSEPLGPAIASAYSAFRVDIPYFLSTSIEEVIKNDLTDMEVLVHRGPELKLEGKLPNFIGVDLHASGPIQVFGARFTSKNKEKKSGKVQIGIRHFVYAGGTYRFVGFFETQCEQEAAPASVNPQGQPKSPMRIRIGGNVTVAKLIRRVAPAYPPTAKQARLRGTVHLQVLISRQGCVKEVEILSGPPLLAQAAQDAVRGWMYQPTLLNGEPVEVVTTVDVVFTLGGR